MKLALYSKQWPRLYEDEAKKIQGVIGALVTNIQHIGSTAIPDIMAKPIIDIAVMLPSLGKAKGLVKQLETIGYYYDESASSSERYFFRKGEPVQYHLSLTAPNVSFWKRQILFRDYLIKHPSLAKEYEELKVRLIEKYPTGREGYFQEKSPFVQRMLELAAKKD